MFLPIGDDNPNEKTPYVHYGILAANVLVFLYMLPLNRFEEMEFSRQWGLVPANFSLVSLFTHMYVHGGFAHIFGNMLFLWIVGDNVEDRLGHVGYFIFYHVAGAGAGLAHAMFTGTPAMPLVGASGAISAVMGAYAVFFPNAKVKIWYWIFLFFSDIIYVSAKWAVGLWFLEQIVLQAISGVAHVSAVAYDAHIGGIAFGVIVAFVLKKSFLREHDPVRRIVVAPAGEAGTMDEAAGIAGHEHNGLRKDNAAIAASVRAGDMDTAFRYFTRAAGGYHPAPLELPTLLQLANALLVSGRYGPAARVYEVILHDFPENPATPEVDFRLGTILSRVFDDYLRAREHLVRACENHPDERRRAQAYDELKWIDAQLRAKLLRRSGDKRA